MLLRLRVSLHAVDSSNSACSNYGRGSNGVARTCAVKFTSFKLSRIVIAKALKDEPEWRGSGFAGKNWDPGLEMEVPFEQRPVSSK